MKKFLIRFALIFPVLLLIFFFYWKSKWPQVLETTAGPTIAISADSRFIATSDDEYIGYLYDLENGNNKTLAHSAGTQWSDDRIRSSLFFNHDGSQLIACGDNYKRTEFDKVNHQYVLQVWDTATRKKLRTHVIQKFVGSAGALFPDDRTLAFAGAGGTIPLIDIVSGKQTHVISPVTPYTNVTSITLSPDGKRLCAAYSYATSRSGLTMYDVNSKKRLWSQGFQGKPLGFNVMTVAFSPDGKSVALKGRGAKLRLLDAVSGRSLRSIQTTEISYDDTGFYGSQVIDFSPDGRFIATGGNSVDVWNLSDGTLRSHLNGLGPVKFSPDGKFLASNSVWVDPIMFDVPADATYYDVTLWKDY